jgi:hypothetical protein
MDLSPGLQRLRSYDNRTLESGFLSPVYSGIELKWT